MTCDSIAFPKLSDAQMELVSGMAEYVVLEEGELLFEVGDKNIPFFVVKSGEVEISESSSGVRKVVVVHGPSSFVGDVDLVTGRAVVVTATARGRCELYRVPNERFHELLSDIPDLSDMILDAFQLRREMLEESGFVGIRLVGPSTSRETLELREFFYKNHVPHTFFDSNEPAGQEQLKALGAGPEETPVISCNIETVKKPSLTEVAECLGISRLIDDTVYDMAIVGAGPAGLSAAVNGASEGLKVLIIDRIGPGGQAGSSSKIENFIGFPSGLSGAELANRSYLQAHKFGVHFTAPTWVEALKTDGEGMHHLELCTGQTAHARCVLAATGVTYRELDLEAGAELEGTGIYYAATSVESRMCRNGTAVVVGGGNSAGQAAMFLAQGASQVKLVIRGNDLSKGMSAYLCNRILRTSRIEVVTGSEVSRAEGDGFIRAVTIRNSQTGESRTIDCAGLFIFIGAKPHTGWLPETVELDSKGFVLTGSLVENSSRWPLSRPPCDSETTLPGVMAAGDVRSGTTKRCGFAVGDGSLAVACAHRYLNQL